MKNARSQAARLMPPAAPGQRFLEFLDQKSFPCVGAKAARARGSINVHDHGALGDPANDQAILDGLCRFVAEIESMQHDPSMVHSHAIVFSGPCTMSEAEFESALWSQLWRVHRLDVLAGHQAADDVSSDVENPSFSLSIAGHPFFVIGLHARASRLARRFSHPTLVFNSHRQFEQLREDGRFAKMQAATRARDRKLQGSINPNLADFGEASEARQYSGREVAADWRCPFDFDSR